MTDDQIPPIVQYPGEGSSCREAIALAVQRVRERGLGGKSVALFAQGRVDGLAAGEAAIVELGLRAGLLVIQKAALQDVLFAAHKAGVPELPAEEVQGTCRCTIRGLTPEQAGAFIDLVFRDVLGLQPLPGDADYGFGADLA